MATSGTLFCSRCSEVGEHTQLSADGKCPKCDWQVESFSEAIGLLASLPVVIPVGIVGSATENPKVERMAESIAKAGAKMGKEVLPEVGKAALVATVFFAGREIWKAFRRE